MMQADLSRLIFSLALLSLLPTQATADPPGQGPQLPGGFMGSNSCSARACHGSMTPESGHIARDEYTVWLTRDRHSDAYASLFKPLARQIALGRGQKLAHEDAACLACHAPSSVAGRPSGDRPPQPREGVGCETCHGAAGNWIGIHADPDWQQQSPLRKRERGFVSLTNSAEVAGQCASCHVGARGSQTPDRDVTHEMIAAGHPRLMFEFSSYRAHMPRHWGEATNTRCFESADRAWLSGQLVSLRMAINLTVARAAGPQRQWPDLSDFDCFSCHHSLRPESIGRSPELRMAERPGGVGQMVYQTWYSALPLRLAQAGGTRSPASLVPALSRLQQVMSVPRPRAAEVIDAGRPIISALEQWQTAYRAEADAPGQLLLSNLARASLQRPIVRWDEAEQVYLGLSALGHERSGNSPVLQLSKMSELLGPGPNQPGQRYDLAPIRAEIGRLAEIINPPQR